MKPAALVLRDLQRAHRLFLMHHDVSLSSLFLRLPRHKFVAVLGRYWDLFLSTWNVSLHGNPARDIYQGINVAASGELGVGVGEEERGSGEREVLEGLVDRTEGLVDLVVSRFGGDGEDDGAEATGKAVHAAAVTPWLGSGREPSSEDGAIFLGNGALSRKSIRDITQWMEDLYTWGEHAYGVIESPISMRKARPARNIDHGDIPAAVKTSAEITEQRMTTAVVSKKSEEQKVASEARSATDAASKDKSEVAPMPIGPGAVEDSQHIEQQSEDGKLDKMVSYLKLGYGQYWTLPSVPGLSGSTAEAIASKAEHTPPKATDATVPKRPPLSKHSPSQDAAGHYLIGLKGEIEEAYGGAADEDDASNESDPEYDSRTVLRAIHVELESNNITNDNIHESHLETVAQDFAGGESLTEQQMRGTMRPGANARENSKSEKLRVVVYVNRPFIFVFLFRLRTDSLAWDFLYRSLHYQLSPLRKPLLTSTRYRPERPDTGGRSGAPGIYDLVWNPLDLTLLSTIPNIPDHLYPADEYSAALQLWSRLDAVNTHLHVLNMYSGTRPPRVTDLERTQKTSRGWWVVWTRLVQREAGSRATYQRTAAATTSSARGSPATSAPPSPRPESDAGDEAAGLLVQAPAMTTKEIFLVRRASDHASSSSGSLGMGMGGGGGADAVSKLAQGIGVDTRRYVEDLLSML